MQQKNPGLGHGNQGQDVKNENSASHSERWNVKEDEIGIAILCFNKEVYTVYRYN